MKIGFIGLGTMGAFMAANLQKSQYKLVVTDLRHDAAKRHIENGAEWADTPRAVAEQCDIVGILAAIDRKIELHRNKRAVLDELFTALLHKLITGEIRVGDLDLSALTPARVAEAAQ